SHKVILGEIFGVFTSRQTAARHFDVIESGIYLTILNSSNHIRDERAQIGRLPVFWLHFGHHWILTETVCKSNRIKRKRSIQNCSFLSKLLVGGVRELN
ncbi:MAG: hypothetical protein OES29_14770, partial [Desulfuromonadales bacterium]|nr:hypothetical protein [Desulfuromonadales bacterium]